MKVIVSCRSSEISEKEISDIFSIKSNLKLFTKSYITPLDESRQQEYIAKFVSTVQRLRDSKFFGQYRCLKTSDEYFQLIN